MENNVFMYHLNQGLSERERLFKLSSAVVDRNDKLTITFIIKAEDYDEFLDDKLRSKVWNIVRELVPKTFEFIIKYQKTISDADYITRLIMEFMYNEAPLAFPKVEGQPIAVELGYDTITVKLNMPAFVYSFMKSSGLIERLSTHLDSQIMETVIVELILSGENDNPDFKVKRIKSLAQSVIRTIDITTTEPIIGTISKMPRYISDIIDTQSAAQTVCGKVELMRKIISKKSGKAFFTFRINDTTESIDVKYFPRKDETAQYFEETVKDGAQIVAEGPLRFDKYLKRNALTLYRAAFCTIDFTTIVTEVPKKTEADTYITIEPAAYIEDIQADIFGEANRALELLAGEYVVFDLETTGKYATSDKIVEFGAVKMVDGAMVETFSTLIDPKIPIPADASRVNNIYDRDVEGKPTFDNVIGDFYKFTRGATLVAHNSAFDMGFLTYHARAEGYDFDNDVIDTLALARNLIPNKRHNLGNLCKHFNIELENAHRALDDAIATAKVFKELVKLQNKK